MRFSNGVNDSHVLVDDGVILQDIDYKGKNWLGRKRENMNVVEHPNSCSARLPRRQTIRAGDGSGIRFHKEGG